MYPMLFIISCDVAKDFSGVISHGFSQPDSRPRPQRKKTRTTLTYANKLPSENAPWDCEINRERK